MTGKVSPITEKAFMAQVLQFARLRGWLCYHTHDARRSTPGFPDLVLVRDRVLWVELKTDAGKLRQEQVDWLVRLHSAGAETFCWRPRDWEEIERELT